MLRKIGLFLGLILVISTASAGDLSAKKLNVGDYANCYMTFKFYGFIAKDNGNQNLVNAYEHFQNQWVSTGIARFGEKSVVAAYESKALVNKISNMPDDQLQRLKNSCADYDPANYR